MSLASTAFHESGHAISILHAFNNAPWLARRRPLLPIQYVDNSGICHASRIYSTSWGCECINERHRDLMVRQVIIDLSGGVAEALYCGKREASDVLGYAMWRCGIDTDLRKAAAVMAHLMMVDGRRNTTLEFAERAQVLMMQHWESVEALATELIAHGRIEGDQVERIVDYA